MIMLVGKRGHNIVKYLKVDKIVFKMGIFESRHYLVRKGVSSLKLHTPLPLLLSTIL